MRHGRHGIHGRQERILGLGCGLLHGTWGSLLEWCAAASTQDHGWRCGHRWDEVGQGGQHLRTGATTETFSMSLIRKQHPASMIIVASTDGQILKALYLKSYGNFLLLHPGAGIPRSGVKQLCMRMQQQALCYELILGASVVEV